MATEVSSGFEPETTHEVVEKLKNHPGPGDSRDVPAKKTSANIIVANSSEHENELRPPLRPTRFSVRDTKQYRHSCPLDPVFALCCRSRSA
mmetsp:Transcript_41933/g.65418  ORF Transcript_41933/g.65418 Transcript_41933/m.65418 type:complete len:91 (+) Transcript_41933:69-341(+)